MIACIFDELSVGQVFKRELLHAINEADNVWFDVIAHNRTCLHRDKNYPWIEAQSQNGSVA